MRRFLGIVLVGFGALFLAAAVGLPLYVAPTLAKLPYDLVPCPAPDKPQPSGCLKPSVAEAPGATFLYKTESGASIVTGTLRSTTEVVPQAKLTGEQQKAGKLGDNAFVWTVYQTVQRTDTNAVVSASSTELALDRTTGEAVAWDGQWIDDSTTRDTTIKYAGLTYKFPFGTEKKGYRIYDSDVRAASAAEYRSVENIEGVEVYHFVQTIPETPLTVGSDDIAALVGLFAPGASTGKVVYSNTREVWIDPVTGAMINTREQPKQVFEPDVGAPVELLSADFRFTKQTVANSAKSAKDNGAQLQLIRLYGPILFGVLAVVFLVGGFLLARKGKGSPTAEPAAWDDSLPKPRRHLRGEERATDAEPSSEAPTWSGSGRT